MTQERPPITPVHAQFQSLITAAAVKMTDAAIAGTRQYLGEPPSATLLASIAAEFTYSLTFIHRDSEASRLIQGDIAGSDYVSYCNVEVSEEQLAEDKDYEGRFFPGRLLRFQLHYGLPQPLQTIGFRIASGPETPPIMVHEGAFYTEPRTQLVDPYKLSNLSLTAKYLPENALYYPNKDELQTLLNGLQYVHNDLSVWTGLHKIEEMMEEDDESTAASTWLKDRLQYVHSVGGSLGALAAAGPYPGRQ